MKKNELRTVKVEPHKTIPGLWCVSYYIDGKSKGGAVFATSDEADEAAVAFMFAF